MTDNSLNEEWRDVKGYSGLYEISSFGRVRSIRGNTARIMALHPNRKDGYLKVSLSKNGEKRTYLVHLLVAAAFLGKCPPGYVVNHKSETGDKTDNRADNLVYTTQLDNIRHSIDVLGHSRSGQMHGRARFTDADVVAMFELRKYGMKLDDIAAQFDTSKGVISHILNGKRRAAQSPARPTSDGDAS